LQSTGADPGGVLALFSRFAAHGLIRGCQPAGGSSATR
jgi:hypothetical protein